MLLIDDREHSPPPTETAKRLAAYGIDAAVKRLDVGDFQFKDWEDGLVLVTRKAADLLTSFYSGHLTDELNRCLKAVLHYGHGSVWFIQDGIWVPMVGGKAAFWRYDGRWRHVCEQSAPSALISAIFTDLNTAGVRVVYTHDVPTTLATLYKKAQKGWPISMNKGLAKAVVLSPWQRDDRVARLMALWPRLTERLAVGLLRKYGSIADILAAVQDGTLKHQGVGQKLLDNIKQVAI